MTTTIAWLIIFVISLYALSRSADWFTTTSEKIGKLLKFPPFVTGVLIVALGTSIPELATSFFGVLQGESAVLSGNVMGSTIANILLGLGLVVVLTRKMAKFERDTPSEDMPFLFGVTILLALSIYDGLFTRLEAVLFLLTYIIYVFYTLQIKKKSSKGAKEDLAEEVKELQKDQKVSSRKKEPLWKIILCFVASLLLIFISAKFVIDSLLNIATSFGIATSVLSASLVAIGTSLPEISVSISSARKGNFDLVIGNIMGSNIFNILVVYGLIGLFTNISVPDLAIYFMLPFMGAVIIFQWLISIDKKITVTEGLLMSVLYIMFIIKLFS
jgi:cation:H+ antiporter